MKSTKLLAVALFFCLAFTAALQAARPVRRGNLFQSNFENATTYRLSAIDVAVSLDGELRLGYSVRERGLEADPKAPPKLVFKTIVTVPAEKSAKWIEIMRGFHSSRLMLVVPKDSQKEPYLIIVRSQ